LWRGVGGIEGAEEGVEASIEARQAAACGSAQVGCSAFFAFDQRAFASSSAAIFAAASSPVLLAMLVEC